MSRVHRRGVIAGPRGGGAAKTYAEFVAHVTSLATGGSIDWYDAVPAVGSYIATGKNTNPGFISLTGTSWGPLSANGFARSISSISGIFIHGFPDRTAYDAQETGGLVVFGTFTSVGTSANVLGATRNGLTSSGGTGTNPRFFCTNILYWNGTVAKQMNPSTGSGPSDYTW